MNHTGKAIRIIHERLENNSIRWAITGSTNMKLQGMKTKPRDLDVIIPYDDLSSISKIFSDYQASPVRELESLTDDPAWEVSANIESVPVQFISGKEDDVYVSKLLEERIKYVRMNGIDVPCLTLEAEAQCYYETGREKKARTIEDFMKEYIATS